MTDSISVRSPLPGDSDAIRAIWSEAVGAGLLAGFELSEIDFLVERLSLDESNVFIATDRGNVAGFLHNLAHVVVVGPRFRRTGIGRRLVENAESALRERDERLLLWLPPHNAGAVRFYDALALSHRSSLWQLELAADCTVDAPKFPDDVALHTIADVDLDEYVALFNTAFAGHPTPLRLTRELLEWSHGRPEFDPVHILVLGDRATGRLIGFCRIGVDRGPGEPGEVKVIGLHPAWRGRGLGRALLAWGVQRIRESGVAGASLTVESENEGALALYERAGFVRAHEWQRFGRS